MAEIGDTAALRRRMARSTPIGGYVTGNDLQDTLPYIAENLSEELTGPNGKLVYYEAVDMQDLSYSHIDTLLGYMIDHMSCEDGTPDDPFYFNSGQIARRIMNGGPVSPQDVLKR
jgi:hypothetical protein